MDDGPWLDDGEQRVWRRFLSMNSRLRSRLGGALQREAGISLADYEVFVHLSEAPGGRARAFELAEATQWEKSRLSHHLTRMVARGLVRREHCPSDRRGSYVALTDAGWTAIRTAAPLHVGHVRRWFIDSLASEDLDTLAEISDRVLAGLDEDDDLAPERPTRSVEHS
ncbi:MAG TPA: MarR family winged helix-turn-helix transcriptional regulator [Acidimicrobiia bacterium]|nr:MarR family winged helix-turn-helix transcriptional regulator [Acidimicrobiia bacterium]